MHYRLGRTLNVPQPIRRPPILIALLAQLQQLAALGFTEAHGRVPTVWQTERLGLLGREVVAAAAAF